jgi:hypothetical protein
MAFNQNGGLGTGTIINLDRVATSRKEAAPGLSRQDGSYGLSRKMQPAATITPEYTTEA